MGFAGRYLPKSLLADIRIARPLSASILVSIGILLASTGGSWDITNHLLNKPETFFAPPHAVLYSGVAIAIAGAIQSYLSRRQKSDWQSKLVFTGIAMLAGAGPVDFLWHLAFGLDGLLSPPHFVLVLGMVLSSLGALAAVFSNSRSPLAVALSILPLWLALSGMLYLFSLPFSKTSYFDFNPNPDVAATLASIAFPFLVSTMLCTASLLTGRKFGTASITGAGFIAISLLTSIVPNGSLPPTVPFYLLNLLPIVAADAVMTLLRGRQSQLAAGAILGLMFITLYYPLITHVYNKVLTPQRLVWPSMTAAIYFDLLPRLFVLLLAPAVVAGIAGSLVASKASKVLYPFTRNLINNNTP